MIFAWKQLRVRCSIPVEQFMHFRLYTSCTPRSAHSRARQYSILVYTYMWRKIISVYDTVLYKMGIHYVYPDATSTRPRVLMYICFMYNGFTYFSGVSGNYFVTRSVTCGVNNQVAFHVITTFQLRFNNQTL